MTTFLVAGAQASSYATDSATPIDLRSSKQRLNRRRDPEKAFALKIKPINDSDHRDLYDKRLAEILAECERNKHQRTQDEASLSTLCEEQQQAILDARNQRILRAEQIARAAREAIEKQEALRAAEVERQQRWAALFDRLKACFPEHWHASASQIIAIVGRENHSISEDDIAKARHCCVIDWFRSLGLPEPSTEQCEVICDTTSDLRIVARAGSGKTRTIAQKILFLTHYLGYKQNEILALVFNRNAREELEKRIYAYEAKAGLQSATSFKILTFDSLAYNLVKPSRTLLQDRSQNQLIRDIVLSALDNEEGLRGKVEALMLSSFRADWENTLRLNSVSSLADLSRLRSFLTEKATDGTEVKSRPG